MSIISPISLQQILDMVNFYVAAEIQVLGGKSITKDGRSWTREDLGEIRRGRREWEGKLNRLTSSPARKQPAIAVFVE